MTSRLTPEQREWINRVRETINAITDETDNQIALRKWEEYKDWRGGWDGDYPAPQEWMTFEDWLQEEE